MVDEKPNNILICPVCYSYLINCVELKMGIGSINDLPVHFISEITILFNEIFPLQHIQPKIDLLSKSKAYYNHFTYNDKPLCEIGLNLIIKTFGVNLGERLDILLLQLNPKNEQKTPLASYHT